MLKKKKICRGCNKEQLLWKDKLCKSCSLKQNKPKSIKKVSEKGILKKEQKKEYLKEQIALFEKHWNSKPHYCESCGKWLGNENNLCFHDHLLEKSNRRDLALNIDNLYLCCFDCHNAKTNGFPTKNHKKAIEKAKQLFDI